MSNELNVSQTTLREAIRILVAYNILETQRGKGTFVTGNAFQPPRGLEQLSAIKGNAKDLYEMRLIFEPEAAYFSALGGTDAEIKRILTYGKQIEAEIEKGEDRIREEQVFHKTIAQTTHNEFMNKIMPILYQAISIGISFNILDCIIPIGINIIFSPIRQKIPFIIRPSVFYNIIHGQ